MDKNYVNCTIWSAQSPGLNSIENVWDYLERKLEKLPTTTLTQLWNTSRDLRKNITLKVVQNQFFSMPRRIEVLSKTKGGKTKY